MSSLSGWLPASFDPLIAEAKRRARQRRFLVSIAVLGVGAVSLAGVLTFHPGPGGGPQLPPQGVGGGGGGSVSTGRFSAVQFSYPATFYERRFANCNSMMTGFQGCERGVMIASYRLLDNPTPSRANPSVKPDDVALALYTRPLKLSGLATFRLRDHSLALWNFQLPETSGNGAIGPPLTAEWLAEFRLNNVAYYAYAWIGTRSTRSERASLAHVIRSIHASGLKPSGPAPRPAPVIDRGPLCTGSASPPRLDDGMVATGGYVCAQVSGRRCTVWTRPVGAPATAVHQARPLMTRFICRSARTFLAEHPRGYVVERRGGLVLP